MQLSARQALDLGWSIIPVKADKRPHIKWQDYRTTKPDAAMITRWHDQYNPSAWGVVTGAISRVIVLDFDGEQGRIALERSGLAPHVQTGSGGFHVYVEYPGFEVKTLNCKSKRELGERFPGVDIRADGGYAIFCGRNESGSYSWLREPVPYPVSAVPYDLRVSLGLESSGADEGDETVTAQYLLSRALGMPGTGRNDAGFLLACQLRDNRFAKAEAEAVMLQYQASVPSVNTKGRVEPYTIGEAMASIRQAYSSAPRETLGSLTIVEGGRSIVVATNRQDTENVPVQARPWPDSLAPEALHGLAGEFVGLVGPHTEADPAALLLSYLVAYGSVIGRNAYFVAEADRHYMNLFIVQVGLTSKGRKGSSLGQVMRLFRDLDLEWASARVQSGLSSGEGLIWSVRDAIEKEEAIKEKGKIVGYQTVTVDTGVEDKRLLVTEGEFASTLRVMGRDGNTLSAVIRNAWDSGNLRILSKTSPAHSTGAHISIIGHITRNELLR